MFETLELEGATVTLDAMQCQKKTVKLIRKQNAHYVLCKGQPKRPAQGTSMVDRGLRRTATRGASTYEEPDAGHSRIELRRYTQLPITEQMVKAMAWADARSVARVERQRHIGEMQTCETVYYITSHEPNAQLIAGDPLPSH